MKKVMYVFFCILFFCSCEKDSFGLDTPTEKSESEVPLMRSASDVANPILQLNGIPVNIRSVSNKTYLSAKSSGKSLYLANRDDGSLRQRWNIEYKQGVGFSFYVSLIGGNSSFKPGLITVVSSGGRYFPQLENFGAFPSTNINMGPSGDGLTYNITTIGDPFAFPMPTYRFLQPERANSTNIIAGDSNYKGDLIKWEVIPVDEFRIENITYDLTTNDQFSVIPVQIANKILVNDTDMPATRVISFQETVTNESSFSETEGLKVGISTSTSAKVGIGKFVEGSFEMGVTTEKTWSYTTAGRETQSYSISESITQEVPPRTTIKAELVATKYNATLTYVAQLYGINTGKTIYLKGKWNGAIVQESKIILTQQNKTLKTIKVTPKLVTAL